MFLQLNQASIIWIIFHLNILGRGNAGNSVIDQDHLAKYPYCGSMYGAFANGRYVMGRITNAKDATKDYRWVVEILRTSIQDDGTFEDFCALGQ